MSNLPLSTLAPLLRLVAQTALKYASRLHAEKEAGQMPAGPSVSLIETNLDETLDRLRGGNIEDAWWRNFLDKLGQEYIAPDFLRESVLQRWLADAPVADDLKVLAKALIMGRAGGDPEIRERLAHSYANQTGEASHLADGPIDVTVAILVAGYIASIPADQRPVASMLQEMSGHFNERFDHLEETRLSALSDPIIQQAHANQTEKELSRILLIRTFNPPRARQDIQVLQRRVGAEGDLHTVSTSTKNKLLYWTARLCAGDPETRASARQIRDELQETDPDRDLAIVEALLAEGDGNTDEALRLLRDRNDPDSRTALFGVLIRSQGEHAALAWYAEQAAPDDDQFFTAIGWKNWAVCMAKVGRWKEAARRLLSFESHGQHMPALAFIEGVINAAMLLPDEHRERVLETVPVYPGVTLTLVAGVEEYHSRAADCFEFAEQGMKDIADLARVISNWRLWLRLMDPNPTNADIARGQVRQDMEEGARAVELIRFAYAFNIPFNTEPLRRYLEYRKKLGGLDDYELFADCLLAKQSMMPSNLVTYLEQHKTRLSKVMPLAFVTTMQVAALAKNGQTEKARTLVAEHTADLGTAQAGRLTVIIDECEGNDPREQLELSYQQTGSLVDLKNLVDHLKTMNDYAALQPWLRELFDRERTVDNAQDLVKCFSAPPFFDHDAIIQFLEDNPDILERSDELKETQAWALFQAGRLQESREINDKLLSQRTNQNTLHLDINLAISSGEWERVATIIEREWPQRESHAPKTLMTLAQFAGHQTSDRALQLAKLAAEKAPDDPDRLIAAYQLHVQLGRDHDVDPGWLERASTLSSADQGPLWSLTLQDVVTEWIPKHWDHLREVEQKWLNGEISIGVAAGGMNLSLARLLLYIPDQNANELDGRGRGIVPLVAGARNPIELQQDWTIGLDVTSLMVLTHLDLLETAVEAFHRIKLSPVIMELLFRERDEARFHQPSRIVAAKQVRGLHSQNRLRVVDNVATPPEAIAAEVGIELATLLHLARQDNGKVICVSPLHKVGSLMEEPADTSEYDDLIHSPMELCTLLYNEGRISTADYQRARLFLCGQGKTAHAALSSSILQGPIYLDRTTLSYLQDVGMLQPMAVASLDLRIHRDVLDEMYALIKEDDVGEDLVTKIERIRYTLRNALDSGAASFLPRTADQDERIQKHEIQCQVTVSLLAGSAACDALCIDDRFINRQPVLTEPSGRSVPLVCVLDVLRYLVSRGRISVTDHWSARHKLRQSGFVFVPIESDELVYWLKMAKVDTGRLKESAELRTLRQTTARIHSLSVLTPEETLALSVNLHRVCKATLERVWEDESLTLEQATALSDWVWRHLMDAAIGSHKYIAQDRYQDRYIDWMRDLLSLRLGHLLLPTAIGSHDRRAHYTRWLERSVLDPLRPANADVIKKALTSVCDEISALDNGQEVYGSLFLEQLPEAARRLVITQNAEFARRCGFETSQVFSIGPEIKLVDSTLFAAAREVFATKKESVVQDVAGKRVSVGLHGEDQHVVVKWVEDVSRQVQIPDLDLLSPHQEVRQNALLTISDRLGPTATDFWELLDTIPSSQLTDQELAAIFEESINGIAAVHASLTQKIRQRLPVNATDLVPQPLSYFARFIGPNPDARDPESYFREILVPYRKTLLARNIRAGLDICCLGALRDDLTPGQWVTAFDDDAVWDALSSCHATSNPFSLLGALDVALYRQEDARFREFAATAVVTLLGENFGQKDGLDIYRLLQMLSEFVLNRLNLLENGPTYPGYWKRMGAWMQAGLIVRAMTESSYSVKIGDFQQWLSSNMAAAGGYADFVQARQEPMVFAGRILLRNEILGRLSVLTSRHEHEGRHVPLVEDMSQALAQAAERGQPPALGLPGPLEGHKRPTKSIPQEVIEKLGDAWRLGTEPSVLHRLGTASQFFAVGEPELDRAREDVKTIGEPNASTELSENLRLLESASIVAAASRNTPLADEIVDALVSIVPRLSGEEEIARILRIMLQAAAVHEAHDAWFTWLEEGLARIATHLPPPPNNCLKVFLNHLGEIERILPLNSWFHVRARTIALAGAA